MKKHVNTFLALAVLLIGPMSANAQLVEYTFSGTLSAGTDYAGLFTGTPGTNLTGYSYTATFELNLANGVEDNGLTYLQIIGGTVYGYAATDTPIVNSVIQINGKSIAIDGGYYGDVTSQSTGGQYAAAISAINSDSDIYPCYVYSPNLPYSLAAPVTLYTVTPSDSQECFFQIYSPAGLSAGQLAYGQGSVTTLTVADVTGFEPIVSPVITGTLGNNGWYTSATTVSWQVTGIPAATISGCATDAVPNTKGKKYTCSATNSLGSAKDSVTVKVDTVKPAIALTDPTNNAIYPLNQSVLAAYACSDATSGVASCAGTVADGTPINTSTVGKQTFSVIATDNAGNTTTKTVTYQSGGAAKEPVFSLAAGTYTGTQTVTITEGTPGAVIHYTTDETTPKNSSPVYGGPITVGVTETLRADAIATGFTRSAVRSASYTIQ